jgi:hypothetical protein
MTIDDLKYEIKQLRGKNDRRKRRAKAIYAHGLASQCAICERRDIVLCCDHDHKTEQFRGWLCHDCNRALGLLRDDPGLARKVTAYLERTTRL